MGKSVLLAVFITGFGFNVFAQNDPEAVKVLDKFSSLALSAPSIYMKFTILTTDQVEGTDRKDSGTIILSKDRYKLELTDNIIWYNGEISWSYLPDEEEVTITRPVKSDNSFQARPSAVFSIYKKGYKCRLLDETQDYYLIDLYPEDINSDHIRIRLTIGKPSLKLQKLEYKYKNGVTVLLEVSDYDLTKKYDPGTFIYPAAKYKDAEVVDMR
jgi:outer membrane lipoprotein-sorting protein